MSAYASTSIRRTMSTVRLGVFPTSDNEENSEARFETAEIAPRNAAAEWSGLESLIDHFAGRVAAAVLSQLAATQGTEAPEWLDSRGAAEYLGVHRDTLRKLAAERTIPSHQDGRGCKLFFKRSDLDDWRLAGGRNAHLATALAVAA